MSTDPLQQARARGLDRLADAFPDAVTEAAKAAERMRGEFVETLPPAAEPATILLPPTG
jgi:hypothetical protein